MLGLVDYGSASDSGSEDDMGEQRSAAGTSGSSEATTAGDGSLIGDDSLSVVPSRFLALPDSVLAPVQERTENALEDIVKPKQWEVKLAEKAKRKLEKKARKKERKELKKKKKEGEAVAVVPKAACVTAGTEKKKIQISLFGGLSSMADIASDSDEEEKPQTKPSVSCVSGLLGILPAPKTVPSEKSLKHSVLLPASVRIKNVATRLPPKRNTMSAPSTVERPSVTRVDSDSEDDQGDFFGLSSKEPEIKVARMDSAVPAIPTCGLDEAAGPSKLTPEAYLHPSEMYMARDEANALGQSEGVISNAEAHRLILEKESHFGGKSLGDAVNNIVDVSVNDALGPNVNAQLLRNLTAQAHAKSAMAPLPKAQNVRDQTARRKHQITYLAQMAVAREEALQEQWAEGRHNKRAAAQKYGF